MSWLLLILFAVLLASAFLWFGWGPRQNWKTVTGWARLDAGEHRHFLDSAAAYRNCEALPEIKWCGHGTMEMEWSGTRLLFDPVGLFPITFSRRLFTDPAPDLNTSYAAICLSHAHMDHLHKPSLEIIPPTKLVLPSGSERFLSKAVVKRHEVICVSVGDTLHVGGIKIEVVRARHGGWRYPWQRGLFAVGFVLKHGGATVYVAGDTAMGDHFAQIAKAHRPRVAVLPIGAYSPQFFLQKRHLNPEEAVQAASELAVAYTVPCHFGTYRVSLEKMDEPLRRFAKSATARGLACFLPVKGELPDQGKDRKEFTFDQGPG